jgi:hypothetical protein
VSLSPELLHPYTREVIGRWPSLDNMKLLRARVLDTYRDCVEMLRADGVNTYTGAHMCIYRCIHTCIHRCTHMHTQVYKHVHR